MFGCAATSPPPTARFLASLRPASPLLAASSARSFATALNDTTTASSSGGGSGANAAEDASSHGSGTPSESPSPESPRIAAINAFIRHRSFAESDFDGLRPLRSSSAGPLSSSGTDLDAWLRSGSGSLAGSGAPVRVSSLRPGSWQAGCSADSPDPPRSGPRDFANRSTPGALDLLRSSLSGRLAQRSATAADARCSAAAERRRELLAASAAPLHLFESAPLYQVCR